MFRDRSPAISVVLVPSVMSCTPILLPRKNTPLLFAGDSPGSSWPADAMYWPGDRSLINTLVLVASVNVTGPEPVELGQRNVFSMVVRTVCEAGAVIGRTKLTAL